jgi:hypothetical protein
MTRLDQALSWWNNNSKENGGWIPRADIPPRTLSVLRRANRLEDKWDKAVLLFRLKAR